MNKNICGTSKGPFHEPGRSRPANILKAINKMALNIRKLLKKDEKHVRQRVPGVFDHAVRLAMDIEDLTSHAVNLPAEDAMAMVDLLEIMIEELDRLVCCIFGSYAGMS